ncbi:MAG: YcaO-like family protein [Desulfobacterales bacterium]|nr:YcaO-like family protein [Desulfobacterales bacterium]
MKKITIPLKDAYKGFTTDQDKIISPEETIARVKKKFKQIDLKILDETVRIDTGRLDIPVYFSICGEDAARLTGTAKQMGKGATAAQAEASAVMELVERFSFYNFANDSKNFVYDTYHNLKDHAIPFSLIASSVHDQTDDLAVTEKIFSELPMRWTMAYNMTIQREMLVPFDWFFMINQFNGTSAGNCDEEALCQGICELVERHVSALICRNKIEVPGIRPESADDPLVGEMLNKYSKNCIQLNISDFTLGMGIPTVGVLAWDPSTFPQKSEIVWTAGTAACPQKALSRALTEIAQLAGDFHTSSNYVASGLPKFTNLKEARYVTQPPQILNIYDLPDISNSNFKIEVENCIAALFQKQMEVIAIPTAHRQLGISAFYNIIPGAHFRERAAATSVGMFACKMIAEKSDPAIAVKKLTAINTILPEKYYIQFYIGSAYLALGEPELAYGHFAGALDLKPDVQDVPSIYSYMGVCRKDLGDYQGALDVLEKGWKLDNERTDIFNLMGFCHFKLKNHEKSIDCFKQVIRLNPSSAIVYANIASNYRDMGEMKNAAAYYRIALSIDPSIDFARENLRKIAGDGPDQITSLE